MNTKRGDTFSQKQADSKQHDSLCTPSNTPFIALLFNLTINKIQQSINVMINNNISIVMCFRIRCRCHRPFLFPQSRVSLHHIVLQRGGINSKFERPSLSVIIQLLFPLRRCISIECVHFKFLMALQFLDIPFNKVLIRSKKKVLILLFVVINLKVDLQSTRRGTHHAFLTHSGMSLMLCLMTMTL